MDYALALPSGENLQGKSPVVVIGPNGSGKTRRTRQLTAAVPTEFINALRNTRVSPDIPAMGVTNARNSFINQKAQSRTAHWELTSDFDFMLSQLIAQKSTAAIDFERRWRNDPRNPGEPEITPLTEVENLWGKVFPGREIQWRDWKPLVKNGSTGAEYEYSGNLMSDGEKAALYLAGRIFSADAGIVFIDEPETHLHSLLAVRLWDALESARPDIRFVYITHDLTFALSRRDARFVIANPTEGLRTLDVDQAVPADVAHALLGAASLSFYASRVIFCEGEDTSLDARLYEAWFRGSDTVVKPVGDCNHVMRCVDAITRARIATALTAKGIIDSDYHPQAFKDAVTGLGVSPLRVHEVESLFCLPDVVQAVCGHSAQPFDLADYQRALKAAVSEADRHGITIQRWKRALEPLLEGLVANVSKRNQPVEQLASELPSIFDSSNWNFSPAAMLEEQTQLVTSTFNAGSAFEILAVAPGKQLLPVAARQAGMASGTYTNLVIDALRAQVGPLTDLSGKLEAALSSHLPERHVPVRGIHIAG